MSSEGVHKCIQTFGSSRNVFNKKKNIVHAPVDVERSSRPCEHQSFQRQVDRTREKKSPFLIKAQRTFLFALNKKKKVCININSNNNNKPTELSCHPAFTYGASRPVRRVNKKQSHNRHLTVTSHFTRVCSFGWKTFLTSTSTPSAIAGSYEPPATQKRNDNSNENGKNVVSALGIYLFIF